MSALVFPLNPINDAIDLTSMLALGSIAYHRIVAYRKQQQKQHQRSRQHKRTQTPITSSAVSSSNPCSFSPSPIILSTFPESAPSTAANSSSAFASAAASASSPTRISQPRHSLANLPSDVLLFWLLFHLLTHHLSSFLHLDSIVLLNRIALTLGAIFINHAIYSKSTSVTFNVDVMSKESSSISLPHGKPGGSPHSADDCTSRKEFLEIPNDPEATNRFRARSDGVLSLAPTRVVDIPVLPTVPLVMPWPQGLTPPSQSAPPVAVVDQSLPLITPPNPFESNSAHTGLELLTLPDANQPTSARATTEPQEMLSADDSDVYDLSGSSSNEILTASDGTHIVLSRSPRRPALAVGPGVPVMAASTSLTHSKQLLKLTKAKLSKLDAEHTRTLEENSQKGVFMATLCHELRNPLHVIISNADFLLEAGMAPERETPPTLTSDQRELITSVSSSAELMMSLVNDYLDMSRLESGRMSFERLPIDLHFICHSILNISRAQAASKGLRLELHIDESVPRFVISDPTRIHQLLLNLISNAIKFTSTGGVTLALRARTDPPGDTPNGASTSVEPSASNSPIAGSDHTRTATPANSRNGSDSSFTSTTDSNHSSLTAISSENNRSSSSDGSTTSSGIEKDDQVPTLTSHTIVEPPPSSTHRRNSRSSVTDMNTTEESATSTPAAEPSPTKCWIELDVMDTGCGIAQENISKLFQPYSQATHSTQREHGGTGLGLSIALQIVNVMNGSIYVTSELGVGSIFHTRLQFEVCDQDTIRRGLGNGGSYSDSPEMNFARKKRSTRHDLRTKARRTSHRILIVDDADVNCKLLARMVAPMGISYDVAHDGIEALEHIKTNMIEMKQKLRDQHSPHQDDTTPKVSYLCVFLDLNMPRMDGWKCLAAIRGELGLKDLPVIALTAEALNPAKALEAGFTLSLSKPFRKPALISILEPLAETRMAELKRPDSNESGSGSSQGDDTDRSSGSGESPSPTNSSPNVIPRQLSEPSPDISGPTQSFTREVQESSTENQHKPTASQQQQQQHHHHQQSGSNFSGVSPIGSLPPQTLPSSPCQVNNAGIVDATLTQLHQATRDALVKPVDTEIPHDAETPFIQPKRLSPIPTPLNLNARSLPTSANSSPNDVPIIHVGADIPIGEESMQTSQPHSRNTSSSDPSVPPPCQSPLRPSSRQLAYYSQSGTTSSSSSLPSSGTSSLECTPSSHRRSLNDAPQMRESQSLSPLLGGGTSLATAAASSSGNITPTSGLAKSFSQSSSVAPSRMRGGGSASPLGIQSSPRTISRHLIIEPMNYPSSRRTNSSSPLLKNAVRDSIVNLHAPGTGNDVRRPSSSAASSSSSASAPNSNDLTTQRRRVTLTNTNPPRGLDSASPPITITASKSIPPLHPTPSIQQQLPSNLGLPSTLAHCSSPTRSPVSALSNTRSIGGSSGGSSRSRQPSGDSSSDDAPHHASIQNDNSSSDDCNELYHHSSTSSSSSSTSSTNSNGGSCRHSHSDRSSYPFSSTETASPSPTHHLFGQSGTLDLSQVQLSEYLLRSSDSDTNSSMMPGDHFSIASSYGSSSSGSASMSNSPLDRESNRKSEEPLSADAADHYHQQPKPRESLRSIVLQSMNLELPRTTPSIAAASPEPIRAPPCTPQSPATDTNTTIQVEKHPFKVLATHWEEPATSAAAALVTTASPELSPISDQQHETDSQPS